jgi:hypothetical protein
MTFMVKEVKHQSNIDRKLLYGIFLVTIIILISLAAYYFVLKPSPEGWTAAIIDQLTIQNQLDNPSFRDQGASILNSSGYDVQYYSGGSITVNFLRDLPAKGEKILLLRTHSAVRDNTDWVDIFTSELYRDGKYFDLAESKQISKAQMYSFDEWYFAIGPRFINQTMRGNFDGDCLIILMGCNSLNQTSMAKALVGKGARTVIGWTSWVEANYTDTFTLELLQFLLGENPYTIQEAVDKINQEIKDNKPNPFNSKLAYYPASKEAASFKVPKNSIRASVNSLFEPVKVSLVTTLLSPTQMGPSLKKSLFNR